MALSCRDASTCNVPVFRYALENWPPEDYDVVVFHRGALSDADRKSVDALKQISENIVARPNLTVRTANVLEVMDPKTKKLFETQGDAALPRVVALFPAGTQIAWAGPLTPGLTQPLTGSPVRAKVTKLLASGESVVFVLVEGGDAKEDDRIVTFLGNQLAEFKKTFAFPEDDGSSPPSRRRLDLPLRLSFSIVRLPRADAGEKHFREMLLNLDPDIRADQAAVYPVFGRGRALCGMAGQAIDAKTLSECLEFLTSGCSCQVKQLNPGVDLLMTADWEQLLEEAVQAAGNSAEKTPSAVQPATPIAPNFVEIAPQATVAAAPLRSAETSNPSESRTLLWIATAVAAGLVVVTGAQALKIRSRRRNHLS